MSDWMQTFTGGRFTPLEPRAQDVRASDIAHALGMLCRYNGHVRRFYSVAEHCVLLSHAVAPEHALVALLHDATEAYVGDMIRPLKVDMPAYQEAEHRVWEAIAEHFGIPVDVPAEVKTADTRILLDERAALMNAPDEWGIEHLEPLGVRIHAWAPATAAGEFLVRLHELRDRQPAFSSTVDRRGILPA